MTGECKFCRQINAFKWVGDAIPTKEDLIEEGTNACTCEAALHYRDREYKINAASECLDRILPNPEEQMTKDILKNAAGAIYDQTIHTININIGNGTAVKMSMSYSAIKVRRTDTSSRQESV